MPVKKYKTDAERKEAKLNWWRERRKLAEWREYRNSINRAYRTKWNYEVKLCRILGVKMAEARKIALEQCR